MYYVYIVQCRDKTLYTGYTVDLDKRIKAHNEGRGAKYTRGRAPIVLKYYENFMSKGEALKRENQIKKLNRSQKMSLISKCESINSLPKSFDNEQLIL